MAKVKAEVDEIYIEGDYTEVPSVSVTCSKCGHQVSVFGRSDASRRRGAVMLKEECPEGETNYYEIEETEQ
jgi:hypothetical protein